MQRTFGKMDWPLTWIEGGACDRGAIAGIQVWALDGGPVERIQLDGRVVGSVFEEGGARHCLLGGLGPTKHSLSPAQQTKQTLERMEMALAQAGFWLADTVRTWFFLEDILSWYEAFNAARTQIYSGVKFRTGSLPASTGVGARNRFEAALTVAARAMQPLNGHARAIETASPLQCPAPAYGSSFSRAMEISTTNGRQLLISGTASIAPDGETLWQNDVQQQVELTMKVVGEILHSRGFTLMDLTRAVAYFKHTNYASAFAHWCGAHGLSSLPIVAAHCDVCRDDLLFELEADARKAN
jgi:enamine deaminase RidA (YjgF/YER057c/UK114 family)